MSSVTRVVPQRLDIGLDTELPRQPTVLLGDGVRAHGDREVRSKGEQERIRRQREAERLGTGTAALDMRAEQLEVSASSAMRRIWWVFVSFSHWLPPI
jgi:hypothetical protein